MDFSVFIDVVTTLLSWWPDVIFDMVKRKNSLNNDELIVILKKIEKDAMLKAPDEHDIKELSSKSYVLCSLGR